MQTFLHKMYQILWLAKCISPSYSCLKDKSNPQFIFVVDAPQLLSMVAIPQTVYTGSHSTVSCKARGSPAPNYRFYSKNGTLLQNSSSSFYISILRYENYADYAATFICVPYNRMGEGKVQNVTVKILGK